jgi:hypothetical protein
MNETGIVEEKKEAPASSIPALAFLQSAGDAMKARAQLRDRPSGERSMETIVATFNALTGHSLSTSEGWEFMVLLKMVRGRQGHFNDDDYVDGAAYFALLGEEESMNAKRRK